MARRRGRPANGVPDLPRHAHLARRHNEELFLEHSLVKLPCVELPLHRQHLVELLLQHLLLLPDLLQVAQRLFNALEGLTNV